MVALSKSENEYTPVQRTETQWQELLDKAIERMEARQGNAEAVEYHRVHFVDPLRTNVELARKSQTGTHADLHYDARTSIKREHLGYGNGKVKPVGCILETRSKSSGQKHDDNELGENASQANPLPNSSDNTPDNPASETIVTIHDTSPAPVRTIAVESIAPEFTKFTTGDMLAVPLRYRVGGYPVAAIKIEPNTVRYGFALSSWDEKLLSWFSEWQLVELNPGFVGMDIPLHSSVPAQPPAHIDWSVKIELMEGLMRSIQSAVFENDLPGVETMFHEFQSEMFKTTKRNRGLLTMAKAQLLARLECREAPEEIEPVDNVTQLPLLPSGNEAA
jgi:hypothetical protein